MMFYQMDWMSVEHAFEYYEAPRLADASYVECSASCIGDEIGSDLVHVIQ